MTKVSKKVQDTTKKQEKTASKNQKTEEKPEIEDPANAVMLMIANLTDYMNEKAQRKLNKQEKKFIKGKVHQWQEYEKNVRKGRLGFNRRE